MCSTPTVGATLSLASEEPNLNLQTFDTEYVKGIVAEAKKTIKPISIKVPIRLDEKPTPPWGPRAEEAEKKAWMDKKREEINDPENYEVATPENLQRLVNYISNILLTLRLTL